jgi:hypothetical protein
MAHRSRWGWHLLDYETFQVLKRLNARCEEAARRYAAWRRWQRKKPHNRVIRRKIRDAEGHSVGTEVLGPRPEPPLDPLFCLRSRVLSFRGENGERLKQGRWMEELRFSDLGIRVAYRTARQPATAPELVQALRFTPDEIHRLAAQPDRVEAD